MAFLNLPTDVYVHLCYFVDPLDIVALSQTCSRLRKTPHEYYIWTSALKAMCGRNGVLSTTFNIAEMSLEELKHAATAPSRLLSKIRQGSPMNPEMVDPCTLQPKSIYTIHTPDISRYFTRACLIPGGRFLLAHDGTELLLYDLDTSKPVALKGDPLKVEYDQDVLFTPCPNPTTGEIRVLMSKRPSPIIGSSELEEEIAVIRFVFDDNENSFVSVIAHGIPYRSLKSTIGKLPYSLVGDLVIYCGTIEHKTTLAVWNYIENTFAIWNVPAESYLEVFVDGSDIVLVTATFLHYWKIPPLHPIPSTQDITAADNLTPFTVPIDWPETYSPAAISQSYCVRLFDWYDSFGRLPSFEFLVHRRRLVRFPTPRMTRFTATRAEGQGEYSLTSHSTADLPRPDSPMYLQVLMLGPHSLCNGWHVQPFHQSSQLYVHAWPGESTSNEAGPDRIVQLVLPDDGVTTTNTMLSRRYFNFDPISGRLAYIPRSYLGRIVVVDYLKYHTVPDIA